MTTPIVPPTIASDPLPCIACGKRPEGIDSDGGNHPYEATAFMTHGHYGSTIFDPMNGTFLEINVCDQCLVEQANAGHILLGQDRKPVYCNHMLVGWIKVRRELTPWAPGLEHVNPSLLNVEPDEVGDPKLYPEIEWFPEAVEYIKYELNERRNKEGR
jgi:hypothetical protein